MLRKLFAPDGNPQGGATPAAAPATPVEPAATPVATTPAEPATPPATPSEPAEPTPTMVPLKALTETQRKFQEARERAAYLEGQLAAQKTVQPEPTIHQHDGPPVAPDIEQYPDDYSAFETAQQRYLVDLAKYEIKQEYVRTQEQQAQVQTQQQIEANWKKAVTTAEGKYPDFWDAISNPEFRQSSPVADAIKSSEVGGEVAYYLAKNLNIAHNLNAMSPIQAAREIGKIEAQILNTPKPTPPPVISQAPDPISTVGGSTSGALTELKDLPMDEYYRQRAPKIFYRR